MDPKNREREVEQWLDAAFGQYGKIEPRTGLESRVLANLRSETNRIALQHRWWWATWMIAVAAAIVVAVWFGESGIRRPPAKPAETARVTHQENAVSKPPTRSPHGRPNAARRQQLEIRPSRYLAPAKEVPKLEQFPSPAPLNEQEKILSFYVQKFPQRAALVARAQTELRKQDEREMAAPWPKNAKSSSDQPE